MRFGSEKKTSLHSNSDVDPTLTNYPANGPVLTALSSTSSDPFYKKNLLAGTSTKIEKKG